VTFRRALNRRLGRPLGLSGSGPTLWALYASESDAAAAADLVRAGLRDGTLSAPAELDPFVAATTIATHPPAEEPPT
jgi:4-diphosphocytidyl-2C-methyl-D-erythritol kinase